MESREAFLGRLNQARVRSNLIPTVPKPFRLRTKERSDLRASNAEKRSNQVKGRADSQNIERLPIYSKVVGSDLVKDGIPSVSMDATPLATRIGANQQSASRPEERVMRDIPELECKVHTLQTALTTLSAQLTLLQRDRKCMISEINKLQLRLQNMEQQAYKQHEEFFALHDAMWERVQHLELVTGQAMPNCGSKYAGSNQKSTIPCLDISSNSCCQPVAAAANPVSAANLVRADSQRTSIDPLNFISLESYGGISLTEEGPGDYEFIMDSAINCSFDGSHVPQAANCVTPTSISIDGGPNQTPTNINEGEKWLERCTRDNQKKELGADLEKDLQVPSTNNDYLKWKVSLSPKTPDSSTNGVRNSSPMSLVVDTKSAAATKDDSVLKSGGAALLPTYWNSMETSNEGRRSMALDEGNESRQQEDLGYWEKCYVIDRLDQCCIIDRFDPFDELPGSYLINEPSDEGKESKVQEEDIVYWEKPYIHPLDESLDEANESRQEEEDEGYWEKPKPCTIDQFLEDTMDQFLEVLWEQNPFWDRRIIEGYLAQPGLPDNIVALGRQMLGQNATNNFYGPIKFNEEEAALFHVMEDHFLDSLPSYIFSRS